MAGQRSSLDAENDLNNRAGGRWGPVGAAGGGWGPLGAGGALHVCPAERERREIRNNETQSLSLTRTHAGPFHFNDSESELSAGSPHEGRLDDQHTVRRGTLKNTRTSSTGLEVHTGQGGGQ
ncbi:unnamed protein product [Arctogadus glacialis]